MSGTLVFDLESNGLLNDVTRIHCLVYEQETDQTCVYNDEGDAEPITRGVKGSKIGLVGHNIIGYDLPLPSENLPVVLTNRLGCRHSAPVTSVQTCWASTTDLQVESSATATLWPPLTESYG